MKPTHVVICLAIVLPALLCAGCLEAPTPTPAPTPTATVIQAAAEPSPTPPPAATATPEASATPPEPTPAPMPTPAPRWEAGLYVEPAGLWGLMRPVALARVERPDERLTVLSGDDGAMLVAVDSYVSEPGEAGNTAEGLRNRARDALAQVFGAGVSEQGVLEPEYPWLTGVAFTTAGGVAGEAVYAQPGRDEGDNRIYGFILAYAAAGQLEVRPMLEAVRDSFKPTAVLPLEVPTGGEPLWAVSSWGLRGFNPDLPDPHFITVVAQSGSAWEERARVLLEESDYVNPGSVRQVQLEPNRIWLTVEGGAGAHSGTFHLLSYAGGALQVEAKGFNSSPGAGAVTDVDGDGTPDVILNQTEAYVFCYACSVRYAQYEVRRWDGTHLVPVQLERLPETAPADVRQPVNRAVELAQAGLWKDAQAAAAQVPASDDATARWDVALIRLHAEAFAELAREAVYPLLQQAFYGDYAAAVDIMRPYTPQEIFSPSGPLIAGTPAEGWEPDLAAWMGRLAGAALEVEPELAAAYYLRGWATDIAEPGSAQALADVTRAAQVAPQEQLYADSLAYLKAR